MSKTVQYVVVKPYVVTNQYDEDRESIVLYETTQDRLGDEIRAHIGGYFDIAGGIHDSSIFVHDEGLLIGLPTNVLASLISKPMTTLAGPAVIAGPPDAEGWTMSVPDAVLVEIANAFPLAPLHKVCRV